MLKKEWIYPLICGLMGLLTGRQLLLRMAEPEQGALLGLGLMTALWLTLAIIKTVKLILGKKQRDKLKD